jgi:hypothetical protein
VYHTPQTAEHDHPEDHNRTHHHENSKSYNTKKFSAIVTVNIAVLDIKIHRNVGIYVSNNSAGGSSFILNVYWLYNLTMLLKQNRNKPYSTLTDTKSNIQYWGGYPVLAEI